MALTTHIGDGNGTGIIAKVSESNNKGLTSKNLHVTIASVEAGFSLPTQVGISGELYDEQLLDGASADMTVDGSTTPVEFTIGADTSEDIILNSLTLFGSDGGIKLENYLGINSALTNGVVVEIKTDDVIKTFRPMVSTNDLIKFASIGGVEYFSSQSGDSIKSVLVFSPAIPIRISGAFGAGATDDDYIKVTINDNLSTLNSMEAFVRGTKAEAGTL